MNKIKVVISGLIYPVTMLHYFWRAFERREDIELFVTGPFFDDWIPWSGGLTLPKKYVKVPHFPLPRNMSNIPSTLVEAQLPWKPNLWLEIDAGWHFNNKPNANIVAHIQTDPHVLKDFYKIPKARSDFNFCMQTPYQQNGEIYLPYAYDPTVHYPMPEVEKIHGACIIGLQYDNRTNLVNRLKQLGLNVYYSIGDVYDEYRLKYNQSKVALSWSSLQDMPARIWEAFGMGCALVTNRVPDLSTFFVEGEHYLGFNNVDEAVNQIRRLLNDENLRITMAEAGHRKAEFHTWDHRIQQLLETVKLI